MHEWKDGMAASKQLADIMQITTNDAKAFMKRQQTKLKQEEAKQRMAENKRKAGEATKAAKDAAKRIRA